MAVPDPNCWAGLGGAPPFGGALASGESDGERSVWPVVHQASRFGILQGHVAKQFLGSRFGHSEMKRDVPGHVL